MGSMICDKLRIVIQFIFRKKIKKLKLERAILDSLRTGMMIYINCVFGLTYVEN